MLTSPYLDNYEARTAYQRAYYRLCQAARQSYQRAYVQAIRDAWTPAPPQLACCGVFQTITTLPFSCAQCGQVYLHRSKGQTS